MCKLKKVKIRKFKKRDLAEIKNLVDETIDICYSDIYCAEAVKFFKDWHNNEKILQNALEGFTIVLKLDKKLIGTGTLIGNEIVKVFVDPVFQKYGFGKLIMRKLEEKAVAEGIHIIKLDASIPSKKFYDLLDYITLEKTFLEVENGKKLDYYKMEKTIKAIPTIIREADKSDIDTQVTL